MCSEPSAKLPRCDLLGDATQPDDLVQPHVVLQERSQYSRHGTAVSWFPGNIRTSPVIMVVDPALACRG